MANGLVSVFSLVGDGFSFIRGLTRHFGRLRRVFWVRGKWIVITSNEMIFVPSCQCTSGISYVVLVVIFSARECTSEHNSGGLISFMSTSFQLCFFFIPASILAFRFCHQIFRGSQWHSRVITSRLLVYSSLWKTMQTSSSLRLCLRDVITSFSGRAQHHVKFDYSRFGRPWRNDVMLYLCMFCSSGLAVT